MAAAAAGDRAPAADLPELLSIEWQKGPNFPQGLQDNQGDIIHDTLVAVAGFCSGETGVPGKPDRYPRGFLRKVWGLDLRASKPEWQPLPEFPGAARQGLQAIRVGDVLYCWGGFSYEAPYCYRDGYRLSYSSDGWRWDALPPLPWPVTAGGRCAVGSRIYLMGGADYDLERFLTASDRNGEIERVGARLLVIDTERLSDGWQELPPCPGTPRWVHAMGAVGNCLYVIGGATGSDNASKSYCTVVDNWRYDIPAGEWTRLDDLPVASGNFPSGAIVFDDRYLLLIGGYQYSQVMNPDGSTRPVYGTPTRHYPDNPMCSDIFVYDVQTGTFGRATPLPLNNNLPMTVLRGNTVHLVGGEIQSAVIDGEHFGHHPDLYLVGRIRRP